MCASPGCYSLVICRLIRHAMCQRDTLWFKCWICGLITWRSRQSTSQIRWNADPQIKPNVTTASNIHKVRQNNYLSRAVYMTVASISNNLMKKIYLCRHLAFYFFLNKSNNIEQSKHDKHTPKNIYYVCRDVNLSGEPATNLILQNSE